MINLKKSLSFVIILNAVFSTAQMGIGTQSVHASAILEIQDINKGLLIPRFSATDKINIANPNDGLLVYNTTITAIDYFNNGWKSFLKSPYNPLKQLTGIVNNDTSTLSFSASYPITINTLAATSLVVPKMGKLFGTASDLFGSSYFENALNDQIGLNKVVASDSPIFSGNPSTLAFSVAANQPASAQFVMNNIDKYVSLSDNSLFSSSSTAFDIITNTIVSPDAGKYLITFNGNYKYSITSPIVFNSTQSMIDLTNAYNTLKAIPATNTTHTPAFGNGEALLPGVYSVAGAMSLAASLTLDGGGNPDAVFVFRSGGALAAGAVTTIILTNGTKASNVFWVSEGAFSIGATSIFKGTCICRSGAIAFNASSSLEGRLFTFIGALTIGPGNMTVPLIAGTYLNLETLTNFVVFTGDGNITNAGPSIINGDMATNNGAVTGLEISTHTGDIYINGIKYTAGLAVIPPDTLKAIISFAIFQDGVLVPFSSRSYNATNHVVSLQAVLTIMTGQTIDIRCKTDSARFNLYDKTITLLNLK